MTQGVQWPKEKFYVDFKDKTTGEWQVGLVISRTKNMAKVRSQGWSSKYDENFLLPSNRLKPFKTHVRGYTGQVKNPGPREHWKFIYEQHLQRLQNLKAILEKQQKTEEDWIQYLRGQHYFYLDFLMGNSYNIQEIEVVYKYFKQHLQFGKRYIQRMLQVGIYKFITTQNQESKAFYQIFDGILMFSGLYPRHHAFQSNNSESISSLQPKLVGFSHEKMLMKLINETKFDQIYLKLLEKILQLNENQKITFGFYYSLIRIHILMDKFLQYKKDNSLAVNKQQRKKQALVVFQILKVKLQDSIVYQIKNPKIQTQIQTLLNQLKTMYFRLSLDTKTYEFLQKMRFYFTIIQIQMPVLQIKLKGLTKFKQYFQKCFTIQQQYSLYKFPLAKFKQLIKQKQLLKLIFVQNQHPQIIKRGAQLYLLFIKNQAIQENDILFIWQKCIQKHEAVRKVILQLWIDLIPLYKGKMDILLKVFLHDCRNSDKIFKQLWQIQMIYQFIKASLNSYQQSPEQNKKISQQLQLIDVGYIKLISIYNTSNGKKMIAQFAKFINSSLQCNQIIKKCYQQLAKGINIQLNILLLTAFYDESMQPKTCIPSNSIKIVLQVLKDNENKAQIIFGLITQIVKFASNMVSVSMFQLQQFQQLWKISQNPQIKPYFNQWILKKNGSGLQGQPILSINSIIDETLRGIIFKQFLCDHNKLDYINLHVQQFFIFKQFMLLQNQKHDKIDIVTMIGASKIISLKQQEIQGSKNIWDIFLNCKNPQVSKQVNKLLIMVHLQFNKCINNQQRKKKVNNFLSRLQKYLKDGYRKGNQRLVRCVLSLIEDTLDFLKEKGPSKHYNFPLNNKFSLKIQFQSKQIEIQINISNNIKQIKQKIAQKFKIHVNQVLLYTKKGIQLGHQFSKVPYCFMHQKFYKLQILKQTQGWILQLITNFIKFKLQQTLIDILQDPTLSQNVYQVLQQIDINTNDEEGLTKKIQNAIKRQRQQNKNQQFNDNQVYFYLLYFKALQNTLQKPYFQKLINREECIQIILSTLGTSLTSQLRSNLASTGCQLVMKILKKIQNINNLKILINKKDIINEKLLKQLNYLGESLNKKQKSQITLQTKKKKLKILINSLGIMQKIDQQNIFNNLHNNMEFRSISQKIFLNNEIYQLKAALAQKLKKIINNKLQIQLQQNIQTKLGEHYIFYLLPLIQSFQGSYSVQQKISSFYQLIQFLIKKLSKQFFNTLVQNKFIQKERNRLLELSDPAELIKQPNVLLKVHLNIFATLIQKDSTLVTDNDVNFILYDCLFFDQNKTTQKQVKCRHSSTIQSALRVLQVIILNHPQKLNQIINVLNQYMKMRYWRSSDFWNVSAESKIRGAFTGLQNPGCICYMNSFLQQLYMILPFRKYILQTITKQQNGQTKLQIIDQLKQLFLGLTYSEQPAVTAVPFSKTIKGSDGKPMLKIFNQMDIDQFSSIMFDRLEKQLRLSSNEDFVKKFFGGIFAHQIISNECPHTSQRQQDFLSISLQVKPNISQSFSCLVRGQVLDGENKYHCEKCDKKVKAQKMLTIKQLPDVLVVALKRFEYNYEIDAKIKKNDYCEFPLQLNLLQFSQQYINKKINKQTQKNQQLPNSHFQYTLKGVVVHTGSADSGHYYSFIKTQKSWYQFNDSNVSQFDLKDLAEQAFGTKDELDEKSKNAYLLIYQRKIFENVEEIKENKRFQVQNKLLIDKIYKQNKQTSIFRLIFSDQYYKFLQNISSKLIAQHKDKSNYQIKQVIINFYLLVILRQSKQEKFNGYSKTLRNMLKNDKEMLMYFLKSVINFNFIEECYVFCGDRIRSKILSRIIAEALSKYYEQTKKEQLEYDYIQKFIQISKNLYVLHGNICDLSYILNKIIIFSFQEEKNNKYIDLIVKLKINKTITTHLLNLGILKQQTQKAKQFKEIQRKKGNQNIGISINEGRKFVASDKLQNLILLDKLIIYSSKMQEKVFFIQVKVLFIKQIKLLSFHKVFQGEDSITIYFLYSCIKNFDLLDQLINSVQKGLKDLQSTKYRQLLLFLYYYLSQQTQTQKSIDYVINVVEKAFDFNIKYFLQNNLLTQWIFKFIMQIPMFYQRMLQSVFLNKITAWLNKNHLPSQELIKKHKSPQNQRMLNRLHGILVSKNQKQYQTKSYELQNYFTKITQQKPNINEKSFDWRQKYSMNYKVGMNVKYYDIVTGNWKDGVIIKQQFDRLTIKCNKQTYQIWSDSQKVTSSIQTNIQLKSQKYVQQSSQQQQNLYD